MSISAYHKGILEARGIPFKLTQGVLERIDTSFRRAWSDIEAILKDSTDRDRISLARYQANQDELTRLINELAVGLRRDIIDNTRQTAVDVSDERARLTNELLTEAGLPIVADFSTVPELTVARLAQRQDKGGLKFSAKRWADGTTDAINARVLSGIARGQSARDMGIGMRSFLLGASDFSPEELADLRRVRGVELRKQGTSLKSRAETLARTEINTAYWEASQLSAQQSPVVASMKWNLSNQHPKWDVCDILSGQNLFGLGAGVYPPEQFPPKPHPSDLCWTSDVLRPGEDWDKPKTPVGLQRNPDDIPKRPNKAQGTDGHIERQRALAVGLIKATNSGR